MMERQMYAALRDETEEHGSRSKVASSSVITTTWITLCLDPPNIFDTMDDKCVLSGRGTTPDSQERMLPPPLGQPGAVP
jgi:hypothetical protein